MYRLTLLTALITAGCGGDDTIGGNENEVITTVVITFTPDLGGAELRFEFDDPDGDGGDPPVVDSIELPPATYTAAVVFENRLEDPAEDITEEVADESDEHQVFWTGTAVDGPATNNTGAPLLHQYADQDANGLPVGLSNTIAAVVGSGDLTITLRHVPPLGDSVVKTADLDSTVASSGFSAIGGSSDAQVTFPVTVQ